MNPPTADVHSFKAAALEMPSSSAAQRRSFPFSVLLLSSSIVSLWGSLFRGIHASAFRPQWPPLYKLSACLPQAFGSCFLFFNKLGGVHQLLQWQMQITDGPRRPFQIFFISFFFLVQTSGLFLSKSSSTDLKNIADFVKRPNSSNRVLFLIF